VQHHSAYPSTFYRVSLKAIIRNEKGEVLVCKEYGSDHYSLPGGGWDHGETEIECLQRELSEEVGYNGTLEVRPFKTATWWLDSRKAWLLWIVYEVVTDNMNFTTTKMCHDVAFVDPTTLTDSDGRTERWIADNC